MKGWEKISHVNGNRKRLRVALHTSDKIDTKLKTETRDKEDHYRMIKG